MSLNKTCALYSILALLAGCSKPIATDAPLDPVDLDMISFAPGESLGYLGSTARTQFSYSFSLSKTEITQAEFLQAMGYNPVPEGNLQSPQKPVVLVSLYEAMLFCNAASKLAGYDTVYSYTSASFAQNRVQSLEGLSANYTANGYRLPTEAEWEYAARDAQGSLYPWGSDTALASIYAWSLANAGGILHNTCALQAVNNLCDMAGNAMEWMDGWYGDIPTDTLTDFVGAASPNSSLARIVKGGSFRTDLLGIRSTQRTDVYATNSNTTTEYLGFRVAHGSLTAPSYQSGGKTISASNLRITVTKNAVKAFFGTSNVKLALADGMSDALVAVDFSSTDVQAQLFSYTVPVRVPTFSPDGQTLTFSNRSEGQTGTVQSFLVKWNNLKVPSAINQPSIAIPRWKILPSGDTALLYTDVAMSNRDSAVWATGKTWTMAYEGSTFQTPVLFSDVGSFHDGLSDNGRWLVTSYTDLRVLDRNSSTVRTLFRSPANGKDATGSTQACNASVRPGSDPEIMFLDFGYDKESALVKRAYRSHEFLFFMDPASGAVNDWIEVPQGYRSWDYSEWSNDSNFIIAAVVDSTEMHTAIYAIRRSDKAMLKLMEGTDLWTPQLWIKPHSDIVSLMDPAMFRYDIPFTVYCLDFSSKLMMYWKQHESLNIAVLGSSRSLAGIDPSYFTMGQGLNLSMSGADPWTYFHLWRDYLRWHSPKLQWVVMELSVDFLYYQENERWEPMWGSTYGYNYDKSQNFYSAGLPNLFSEMVQAAETPVLDIYSSGGHLPSFSGGWGSEPSHADWGLSTAHPDSWKESLTELELVLDEMEAKNIKVVGMLLPQSPQYQDPSFGTTSWGRYGPSVKQATVILDSLQALSKRHPNMRIFDQHLMGKHDYSDTEAQNWDHLASAGATKLSFRIDSLMQAWK
jgi:uncharacterized protein (TIGR02171 family)